MTENTRGLTALHMAAARGNTGVVEVLLDHGANTEIQEKHGWTALHLANLGGHVEAMGALIEGGANVNAQDNCGNAPLHWAEALDNERNKTTCREQCVEVFSKAISVLSGENKCSFVSGADNAGIPIELCGEMPECNDSSTEF